MSNLDSGNDSVEYIAWRSQEKTWSVDGEKCDLKKFLIDTTSIKIGQGKLQEGVAPIWEWNDVPGGKIQLKDGYKKAFYLSIYLTDKHGSPVTGWREWMTNQRASREAVMKLWKDIQATQESHKDEVAMVKVTGNEMMKVGQASICLPTLELDGWVTRPGDNDNVTPISTDVDKPSDTEF